MKRRPCERSAGVKKTAHAVFVTECKECELPKSKTTTKLNRKTVNSSQIKRFARQTYRFLTMFRKVVIFTCRNNLCLEFAPSSRSSAFRTLSESLHPFAIRTRFTSSVRKSAVLDFGSSYPLHSVSKIAFAIFSLRRGSHTDGVPLALLASALPKSAHLDLLRSVEYLLR